MRLVERYGVVSNEVLETERGSAIGVRFVDDTVLRLAQVPGIIGIKEATGNIERAQWLIRDVPQGFAVLSGDDPTAVALMLCGGQGNISVTANLDLTRIRHRNSLSNRMCSLSHDHQAGGGPGGLPSPSRRVAGLVRPSRHASRSWTGP